MYEKVRFSCQIRILSTSLQEDIVHISIDEDLLPVLPTPEVPVTEVFIGSLRTRAHRVRGDVYALGERTIMIRGFHYDGTAPGM